MTVLSCSLQRREVVQFGHQGGVYPMRQQVLRNLSVAFHQTGKELESDPNCSSAFRVPSVTQALLKSNIGIFEICFFKT